MEAKSTPGPWKLVASWDRDNEVSPTYSADGYCNNPFIIGERSDVVGCDEYDVFYGATKDERAANIRLMLAAPEMLAMLKEAVALADALYDGPMPGNCTKVFHQFIARIEGGTEGGGM